MNTIISHDRRMSFLEFLFLIGCLAALAFYFALALFANSDLSEGRFALFMDERITFDGVKKILHPKNMGEFLSAVFDGGDHRYGRILWNSIAFFSFIPERMLGDSGQIIAARMLQVVLVIGYCSIFTFCILKTWFLRLVATFTILSVPFSEYYMTMPKPEPLQLFFLVIFCYFYIKKNATFSWYWIFIGLAFGAKISTLPALLVFLIVSLLVKKAHDEASTDLNGLAAAVGAFALGLVIAVPILCIPFFLGVGVYLVITRMAKIISHNRIFKIGLSLLLTMVVLLISRNNLKIWISNTFLNTAHGSDRGSINALTWVGYFFESWIIAPSEIGIFISILIMAYLVLNASLIIGLGSDFDRKNMAAFAVVLAGFAMNFAVILSAKRLWGFYFYPGALLIVMGIILLVDIGIHKSKWHQMVSCIFGNAIAFLLLLISIFYWMPNAVRQFKILETRTISLEYKLQYDSYRQYLMFLENFKAPHDNRLRVIMTPSLFPPESNEKYQIMEFWGPFNSWDQVPDIIIFGKSNTPRGPMYPEDSPEYIKFLEERKRYGMHVSEGRVCESRPCYQRELELLNGGEILILKDK